MPKVYIALPTSDTNFFLEDRERLRAFAEVVQHPGDQSPTDEEKRDACRSVDGMVIGRSGGWLTKEIVDAAENLKVVGVVGGSVARMEPEYVLHTGP